MKIINLKRARNEDVVKWLENSIPNLTPYQKEKIREDEIVRFSRFKFMEPRKKVENIWTRLSVIFIPFVYIFLITGLPFNFFITGKWGYGFKKVEWFTKWLISCGL